MTGLEIAIAAGLGYAIFGGSKAGDQPGGGGGAAPLPGEQAGLLVRSPDGTLSVQPQVAQQFYRTFDAYAPQLDQHDGRIVFAMPRNATTSFTLRNWADQVVAGGGFVLLALREDVIELAQTARSELSMARGAQPGWAVLLSPVGAVPQAPPAPFPAGGVLPPPAPFPGGGAMPPAPFPGGGVLPPGPQAPQAPVLPASFSALPPELLAKVVQVYQSGTARQNKDLGASLARRYPDVATELRQRAAERAELERINAASERRIITIPANRWPSDLAQHYAGDFAAWPELLETNLELERKGDNLTPWRAGAELILPGHWHFERPALAPRAGAAKPAPAAPAPAPAPAAAPPPPAPAPAAPENPSTPRYPESPETPPAPGAGWGKPHPGGDLFVSGNSGGGIPYDASIWNLEDA